EGARVLLTIGRKEAEAFFNRTGISGVARMIEPPACEVPPHWTVCLARPPFALSDECGLIKAESIDCLVSKDAGGDSTSAKLDAARECGLSVVMISRPRKPEVPSGGEPVVVANLLDRLIGT